MAAVRDSFFLPIKESLIDAGGAVAQPWVWFFKSIYDRLSALGVETSFTIANNASSATDVTGLSFDYRQTSQAVVEYLIQRTTTGVGGTELVESGIFIVSYKPKSNTWALHSVSVDQPNDSGVTFSVTSDGQVRYTSSNITGTASISKLTYRARTLAGKHHQYSSMSGGR